MYNREIFNKRKKKRKRKNDKDEEMMFPLVLSKVPAY